MENTSKFFPIEAPISASHRDTIFPHLTATREQIRASMKLIFRYRGAFPEGKNPEKSLGYFVHALWERKNALSLDKNEQLPAMEEGGLKPNSPLKLIF
nr:hypothetical protein [uncultured Cohaesibacter sp.]